MQSDDKLITSNHSLQTSGYNTASSAAHIEPNNNNKSRRESTSGLTTNGGSGGQNVSSPQQNNYASYVTGGPTHSSASNHSKNGHSSYYNSKTKLDNNGNGSPVVSKEQLCNELLAMCGPSNTYQLKDHALDIGTMSIPNASPHHTRSSPNSKNNNQQKQIDYSTYQPSDFNSFDANNGDQSFSYDANTSTINQDPDPIRITKPNSQNVIYKQEVKIKYLQPPTPPPPAPIIIREKQLPPENANQPPIIIRQTAPCPPTPEPLTIREKAPTPPLFGEPTIIERPIPAPAQPPRQVIIERVPAPPAKPRPIIYEKWLPYKSMKRPVIVQKIKQQPLVPAPRNVIIEYEKPKAVAIRHVIEEGVIRADPATYQIMPTHGEIRYVDRITDLPIENSNILNQLNLDSSSNDNNQYAHYLSATTSAKYGKDYSSNAGLLNSQHSSLFEQYNVVTDGDDGQDYDTITTSVSESLAAKIIAEARAAGAICRSSSGSSKYN